MLRAWLNLTTVALLLAGAAWGTPYWVEYSAANGNFPETEGWTRYTTGGGDARYFEDGALVLDGQPGTHDAYAWYRPGELDPGPQELFVARWRLCVSQVDPPYPLDPIVGVNSDEQRGIHLYFGYESIQAGGDIIATFEAGVFHDYELRSPNMLTHDLYIDYVLAYSGESYAAVGPSFVAWGDGGLHAGSSSRWAGFSFGVIPEPCSVWLLLGASLLRLKPRG
jgi:hypothetical protein